MLRIFVLATIFFLAFLVSHWSIFWFFNPEEKVNSLLITFVIFLVSGVVVFHRSNLMSKVDEWASKSHSKFYKLFANFFYGTFFSLLFIGYLEFYFTVDRSITFRILTVIEESENKSMKSEDVLALYNTENIILSRFDDLEYGGYLFKKSDESYSLTAKGSLIEWIYRHSMIMLRFGREEYIRTEKN